MGLTESEASRLRVEDGIGSAADERQAVAGGHDPAEDRAFRKAVRAALIPEVTPPLADQVMARLGSMRSDVRGAVQEEAAPRIADSVMSVVTDGCAKMPRVSEAIRAEAGNPHSMWGAIGPAVGADIGRDIGALFRGSVNAEGNFEAVGWMTPRRRYAIGGVGVALAAAAALLFTIGLGGDGVGGAATSAMTPILDAPVDIEDLEVGASNLVQVLQFGEDAPTIIFVSDDAGDEL